MTRIGRNGDLCDPTHDEVTDFRVVSVCARDQRSIDIEHSPGDGKGGLPGPNGPNGNQFIDSLYYTGDGRYNFLVVNEGTMSTALQV